jgi:hypothetical protein
LAHRVSSRRGRKSEHDLGIEFRPPPALRGQGRFALGRLLTRWAARLRRSSLDAALARGDNPCESPALAHRAARLTSERSRERMAASVVDMLATARRPPSPYSAAVKPHRDEIAAAAPLLTQIGELLRSNTPIYSQGVAMLEHLLRDGGGPLYLPAQRGALTEQLEVIAAALEGRLTNLDDQ